MATVELANCVRFNWQTLSDLTAQRRQR